jgi:hypothetical protein
MGDSGGRGIGGNLGGGEGGGRGRFITVPGVQEINRAPRPRKPQKRLNFQRQTSPLTTRFTVPRSPRIAPRASARLSASSICKRGAAEHRNRTFFSAAITALCCEHSHERNNGVFCALVHRFVRSAFLRSSSR